MTSYLNRVRVLVSTVGTGTPLTLGNAYSNSVCSMSEAGAVDGATYSYVIQDGNDFEVQENQVYTASGGTITRGTPKISKIGGVAGTTKLTLSGTAVMVIDITAGNLSGLAATANNLSDLAKPYTGLDNISIHGADIASAATLNLDAATGNFVHVTGATGITAITLTDGRQRTVFFTGAPLLTNGANLVLPGGQNIQAGSGDIAVFVADGTIVRCTDYLPATQTATRILINAAPIDALAYNGIQLNGSFDISQEYGNAGATWASGTAVDKYVVDGWSISKSSDTYAFTGQQAASVFPGYASEIKITITAAKVNAAAALLLYHKIEGSRFVRARWGTSAAVPVTVGMWVKSSVAGQVFIALVNTGFVATSSTTFTIAQANVAQWVTATFAPVTTSTWPTGNTLGASCYIYLDDPSSIRLAATNGNTFEMTGFVMLPGIEIPSSDRAPFIMRPADQEAALAKRYYQIAASNIPLAYQGTGDQSLFASFQTEMRANPTVVTPITDANYATTPTGNQWGLVKQFVPWASKTGTVTIGFNTLTTKGFGVQLRSATWGVAPDTFVWSGSNPAFVFDARL